MAFTGLLSRRGNPRAPPRLAPRSFQLLITTRLRDPRFPFDVIRNATVANFSITRGQLSELLITATLRHELPDLEAEHLVLMRQRAKGEADLLELEDQVGGGGGTGVRIWCRGLKRRQPPARPVIRGGGLLRTG